MSRFFIDKEAISDEHIIITGEDVQHIRKVLRMRQGEKLIACDMNGTDFECEIESINEKSVDTRILQRRESDTETPIKVTLFQGIPKSDKMELIIQKCVELGVYSIVPVKTERTVVKFENSKDEEKKQQRWQKIANEAAKQCNRGRLPEVNKPVGFNEALTAAKGYDLVLVPYENEEQQGLKQVLKSKVDVKSIAFFIGPEGGFTEEEIAKSLDLGYLSVSLGKRILRTETAGLTVLSILMYELGDVG